MEQERYATQVLNYGGGEQTVAMCVLIVNGIIPRPDRIVMADTSREVKSTWSYLLEDVQPYLARHGLKVEIAPHSLATADIYAHNGDMLMPVFTATGKLRAFCSGEWKVEVVKRYLRSTGVTSATQWIGYAFDETRRWKGKNTEDGPWRIKFPLVDIGIVKADCPVIIRKAGLRPARKSRCKMCPNQSNAEWRELRDSSPEEFEDACKIDEEIREEDDLHAMFLHQDRVPLRDADLDRLDRKEPDRQCTLGACFI